MATVVSVYRQRNASALADVLRPCLAAGNAVRLWALDHDAPELATWTVGVGPGGRFQLLNRLLIGAPPGYIVASDDDFEFAQGNLAMLLRIVDRYGFDLAQPAHASNSAHSYPFTKRQPFSVARETTFVEIGPLMVISPRMRKDICPFPERTPMGWGVDAEWTDFARSGERRFAIVDAVRIRHFDQPGSSYADDVMDDEVAVHDQALSERGVDHIQDLQRTLATHRLWRMIGAG